MGFLRRGLDARYRVWRPVRGTQEFVVPAVGRIMLCASAVSDSLDNRPFPLTPWTLVAKAGEDSSDAAREAMGRLLQQYVPALKVHLVLRRRMDGDRANDVLQGFISKKVLEQNLLSRTDRTRGRFRSFILKALDHYAIDENRKQRTRESKLEPEAEDFAITDHADPDGDSAQPLRVFEVAWAKQVLSRATELMREQCRASARQDLWGVFEERVLRPTMESVEPMDYETLVERFSLRSPAHASNVLMTAKRMFARTLRGVVSEYAESDEEVEEELTDLRTILGTA